MSKDNGLPWWDGVINPAPFNPYSDWMQVAPATAACMPQRIMVSGVGTYAYQPTKYNPELREAVLTGLEPKPDGTVGLSKDDMDDLVKRSGLSHSRGI